MSDDPGGLQIGIGASIDQASIAAAKAAIAGIGGAFAKTFDEIERSKALASAAKDFAAMAVAENDAAKAAIGLSESLKELNATDKEIEQSVKAFEKEALALRKIEEAAKAAAIAESERAKIELQASIDRDEESAYRENASRNSAGPQPSGNPAEALRKLSGAASRAGATGVGAAIGGVAEIADVSRAFKQLKSEASAIPDLLSGFAQSLGLIKTAQEGAAAASGAAATAEGLQTVATGGVAVASGGAAVGLGAVLVALAPIALLAAAVAGGIALVSAAMADSQKKSKEAADGIRARYAAEKEIDDFANSGATRDEALKRRADLEREIADNTRYANEALAEKNATFANDAKINSDFTARLHAGNEVYKALDETITDSSKSAADAAVKLKELNEQIEGGSFAAATAKDQAAKAADDKEKADAAQAQATEKAAREAEQAQAKKQAADEKAAREAEAAAEKIKSAQEAISKASENYANKQIDIAKAAGDKLEDIAQSSLDKTADTNLKYYRDTVKIAEDARAEELKSREKFTQSEIQAGKDTNRKLEDIRDEAIQSEQDALESRNFLAAAKVRESLDKSNRQALKEADRAAEDRLTEAENEAKERYIELQKARTERVQAFAQERQDNKTANDRAIREAKTAKEHQLQDLQISYARESATLQAHLAELGGINAQFYAQQTAMAQAAANGGSTQTGISSTGGTSSRVPLGGGTGGIFTPGSGGGYRPIPTAAGRNVVNNVTISANTSADVYNAVTKLGLI